MFIERRTNSSSGNGGLRVTIYSRSKRVVGARTVRALGPSIAHYVNSSTSDGGSEAERKIN